MRKTKKPFGPSSPPGSKTLKSMSKENQGQKALGVVLLPGLTKSILAYCQANGKIRVDGTVKLRQWQTRSNNSRQKGAGHVRLCSHHATV
jgi:hypothetical protein